MPHIILEYSENLPELPDFRALFDDIHQTLNRLGGIRLDNCKSRARRAEHVYVGDGDPDNAFIHLAIEFVEGVELLRRYYHLHLSDRLQITVRVAEISLDYYFKDPAGTLHYQ